MPRKKPDTECQTLVVHQDVVDRVKASTPAEETLQDLAEFFRIFGDTTRIKILHALFISEMCVCDLSAVTGISQSAVSHQLKTLRQSNLVAHRREGKTVFYSLKDEHVGQIMGTGMTHIRE